LHTDLLLNQRFHCDTPLKPSQSLVFGALSEN
jgi:hypothetical protein